jgi:hypothetical protein
LVFRFFEPGMVHTLTYLFSFPTDLCGWWLQHVLFSNDVHFARRDILGWSPVTGLGHYFCYFGAGLCLILHFFRVATIHLGTVW